MVRILLLITLIILCESLSRGFMKLSNFSFKRRLNVMLSSTFYYDGNNGDRDKKFVLNTGIDCDNYTLYTLIWFDCYDCNKLLQDANEFGKDVLYINGSYYFFDESDANNSPLFYKDDSLIATDLFSIYEELFYDILLNNVSSSYYNKK